MQTDIVFIVLTYFPDTQKVLRLLRTLEPYQVVLVDNTPEPTQTFDQSLTVLKKSIPDHVIYIKHNANTGYTGGVNTGLKEAKKLHALWSVVLNDDLVLTNEVIRVFAKKIVEVPVGIAGPYPRFLDEKRWTTTTHTQQRDHDFISGSFFAIHTEVIQKLGLLYDPYFIFYEEVEYCVRAKNHGYPLTAMQLPEIEHKESSTFEHRTFLHQYYLARNHMLFVERNAPINVKMYEIIRFPKTLLEHIQHKEQGALEGIRDYFLRKFGPHAESLKK